MTNHHNRGSQLPPPPPAPIEPSLSPEQQMEQEINHLLQVYDSSVWEQRRQELKEQRRRKGNKK